MNYSIFMDESGDLGFGEGSSNYFIISFLITTNKRPLEKLVKKFLSSLKIRVDTLHATKDVPTSVRKFLKLVAEQDIVILTIKVNKSTIPLDLQEKKHTLYNLIVNQLFEICAKYRICFSADTIEFIASRRETKKMLNTAFVASLWETAKKHQLRIKALIKSPHEEKGLQVVDAICWAMYQKWELYDASFYQIIQDLIKAEMDFEITEKPHMYGTP
jgi:hypothetical protein